MTKQEKSSYLVTFFVFCHLAVQETPRVCHRHQIFDFSMSVDLTIKFWYCQMAKEEKSYQVRRFFLFGQFFLR
jgi:hypothetical protein